VAVTGSSARTAACSRSATRASAAARRASCRWIGAPRRSPASATGAATASSRCRSRSTRRCSTRVPRARLFNLGYWIDAIDGHYGLTTSQAVTAFQKLHDLPRTGVFDIRTRAVLSLATRPVPRSPSGYVVEVDKPHQVILVARNGHTDWVFNTSTGGDYQYSFGGQTYTATTPVGHFTILRQIDGLRVGRLGSLWRPKYFTNDGVAFHGYSHVPNYPASHGCVRMTNQAINWVWANNVMPLGTSVFVY
jgi:hypothetical protein